MDIGKALGFAFEDDGWVTKMLLGGLFLLIPIFGTFAVMGYMIVVIRNVLAGQARPLPEWTDLGRKFMDGLLVWLATMLYALPMFVLACPIALSWLLPLAGRENQEVANLLTGLSAMLSLGLGCLLLLYGILLAFLTPAVYLQFAGHGQFGPCLRVGDIVRFALRNLGSIAVLLVLYIGLSLVISLGLGLVSAPLGWVPCLGWVAGILVSLAFFPVSVWLMAVQGHLIGQIGLRAGLPSLT